MAAQTRLTRPAAFPGVQQAARAALPVVEPELDMKRKGPRGFTMASRLWSVVRWFMAREHMIEPPMRSVDRESQEFGPLRDR